MSTVSSPSESGGPDIDAQASARAAAPLAPWRRSWWRPVTPAQMGIDALVDAACMAAGLMLVRAISAPALSTWTLVEMVTFPLVVVAMAVRGWVGTRRDAKQWRQLADLERASAHELDQAEGVVRFHRRPGGVEPVMLALRWAATAQVVEGRTGRVTLMVGLVFAVALAPLFGGGVAVVVGGRRGDSGAVGGAAGAAQPAPEAACGGTARASRRPVATVLQEVPLVPSRCWSQSRHSHSCDMRSAMSSTDALDLAPINAAYSEVTRWLKANGPAAATLAGNVAYAPTFSDQSFPAGIEEVRDLWVSGGWVSWLGGPAVAPLESWPTAASGLPLAHVITVCLEDLHGVSEAKAKAGWSLHDEGLPTTGALEVFHDLATFGQEAGDATAGAWQVRWTPAPDRSLLVQGPDTSALDGYPSAPVCQAGTFLPGWNLPAVADFARAPADVFDAAQDLCEDYGRAWMVQRQIPYRGAPYNVTHAYGHAQHAASTAEEVLPVVLPLADGDRHRLVLDIESYTHLSGWFGDLGNLQVWMRQSDLEGQNFDAAWCMIRTD